MNCDYCGKKTSFLEDLGHCSVCLECLNDIEDQEDMSDNQFDLIEKKINLQS